MKIIFLMVITLVGINLYNYNTDTNIVLEVLYRPSTEAIDISPVDASSPKPNLPKKSQTRFEKQKDTVATVSIINNETVTEYLSKQDLKFIWKEFKTFNDSSNTLQLVDTMSASEMLLVVLTDCEGFIAYPKRCGGNSAIGFGHAIKGSSISYYQQNPISKEEAYRFLIKDVSDKAADIRKHFKGSMMTQGQFDALVSLCYSTGYGSFMRKDVVKNFQKGYIPSKEDFIYTVCDSYRKKYPGLVKRRLVEFMMFKGKYLYINKHNILK